MAKLSLRMKLLCGRPISIFKYVYIYTVHVCVCMHVCLYMCIHVYAHTWVGVNIYYRVPLYVNID